MVKIWTWIWSRLVVMRFWIRSLVLVRVWVAESVHLLRVVSRIFMREVTLALEILIQARSRYPLRVQGKLPVCGFLGHVWVHLRYPLLGIGSRRVIFISQHVEMGLREI